MRILKKGERVDWQYGGDIEYITDKDIEELKQGKRAVIDVNGEYTIVLKYRKKPVVDDFDSWEESGAADAYADHQR